MPRVNPRVLTWARESAGLSLNEATVKFGWRSSERLAALEAGELEPSRPQILMMAEKYRRPLLTFYLPEPPRGSGGVRDFRKLTEVRAGSEAILAALVRDVQARQALVRAALEDAEEDGELPFVASANIDRGIDHLVGAMRETLRFSVDEFRAEQNVTSAFAAIRSAAEQAGIFVLLMGNLGSHHSDLEVEVFRGFALADPVAPFVVINEKDLRAAWAFTLLHELAHIWLGQTGISAYGSDIEIEKFCDAVAARFLLDPNELDEIDTKVVLGDLKDQITNFADQRNLSRKMVSYNLLATGRISRQQYVELCDELDADRLAERQAMQRGDGAPDYYVVRRHRIGPGLIGLVRRMVLAGVLSTTKAGRVLGVKPTAVFRAVDNGRAA